MSEGGRVSKKNLRDFTTELPAAPLGNHTGNVEVLLLISDSSPDLPAIFSILKQAPA